MRNFIITILTIVSLNVLGQSEIIEGMYYISSTSQQTNSVLGADTIELSKTIVYHDGIHSEYKCSISWEFKNSKITNSVLCNNAPSDMVALDVDVNYINSDTIEVSRVVYQRKTTKIKKSKYKVMKNSGGLTLTVIND